MKRFRCVCTLGDFEEPRTYFIEAPSADVALLLAAAMDGALFDVEHYAAALLETGVEIKWSESLEAARESVAVEEMK